MGRLDWGRPVHRAFDPDAAYDQRRALAVLDKPYPLEDRLLESKMLAIFDGDPPEHILIVDDDERIQTMIYSILGTEFGYQVTLASNGQEAVDLIRDGLAPDLVLMDLQMPVMDGMRARAGDAGRAPCAMAVAIPPVSITRRT